MQHTQNRNFGNFGCLSVCLILSIARWMQLTCPSCHVPKKMPRCNRHTNTSTFGHSADARQTCTLCMCRRRLGQVLLRLCYCYTVRYSMRVHLHISAGAYICAHHILLLIVFNVLSRAHFHWFATRVLGIKILLFFTVEPLNAHHDFITSFFIVCRRKHSWWNRRRKNLNKLID